MSPDALAAVNPFPSIDDVVAEMDAADKDKTEAPETDAASTETPNTEADPAAEDADEPEAAIEGDDAETEDGEAEEESEQPAIEPPRFWDAEGKAAFSKLPPELQKLVLAKQTESDVATSKKFEEAANIRKVAEAEASKLAGITSKLDKLIPEAEQTFATRWGTGEIDWNRVAQEQGVERAFQLKNDHDRELTAVQQLKVAKQEVDAVETQKFVAARFTELKTLVPELGDEKTGPAKQLELVNYISANYDVPASVVVKQATAKQLLMAHKAYLYDKLNADAKASVSAPKVPAKQAVQARPSVKSTAAPARAGSPQHARLQQLSRMSSRTVDEAVEYEDLREATNR